MFTEDQHFEDIIDRVFQHKQSLFLWFFLRNELEIRVELEPRCMTIIPNTNRYMKTNMQTVVECSISKSLSLQDNVMARSFDSSRSSLVDMSSFVNVSTRSRSKAVLVKLC